MASLTRLGGKTKAATYKRKCARQARPEVDGRGEKHASIDRKRGGGNATQAERSQFLGGRFVHCQMDVDLYPGSALRGREKGGR